jgi:hypothetical protein
MIRAIHSNKIYFFKEKTIMTKTNKIFGFIGGTICALGLVAGVGYVSADAGTTNGFRQAAQIVTQQQDNALEMGRGGQGNGVLSEYLTEEDIHAAVADVLGITVDDLLAAKDAGTRLPDLAEELGVDIEVVHEAVQVVRAEAIQHALNDGAITQEEADQLLSQEGRPFGQRGGRGHGQGRGDNGNFVPSSTNNA